MLAALVLGALAFVAASFGGDGRRPDAVVLPAAPASAPPLNVGLVANSLGVRGSQRAAEQARVRATEVRWIREELPWNMVEPWRGARRWEQTDALFVAAARRGLRVLPLLLGSPRWAARNDLALPANPDDFGAFAARAAARYGPGGSFWRARPRLDARLAPVWFELWNEPYLEAFSVGGIDPSRYGRMVRSALTAGRGANPRVRWLMSAELVYEGLDGTRQSWLDAIAADDPGLLASVDGFAVHPYSFFAPGDEDDTSPPFRFARVGTIADELAARGAGRQPLWITELGWSTCDRRPDCVDEREQARRLALAFSQVRTTYAARVRALFVYHLRDFPNRARDDREAHYGLLRTNGSRKPAWSIVRQAARAAAR
jgi:hypothetical protein